MTSKPGKEPSWDVVSTNSSVSNVSSSVSNTQVFAPFPFPDRPDIPHV